MLAERISNYLDINATPSLMADNRPVSVVWAKSMIEKEAVFNIRYKVYCEHLGYENTTQNPNQMEMDIFDGWSRHLLIRDDLSSKYVGTMRIVEPFQPEHTIPIESHYQGDFNSPAHDPAELKAGRYVEISRLAISPQMVDAQSMRYAADTSRLLYLTAIAYFQKSTHLSELYWLAEQRLARRLSILGLPSLQIGDFVEYRGQRAPYLMRKERLRLAETTRRFSLNSNLNQASHTAVKPLSLSFKGSSQTIYQQILNHKLYLPSRP